MTDKNFNFKIALEELKKINEEFDSKDIDLDMALEKFRRGLEIAKQCKEKLRETENEIIKLKEKFSSDDGPADSAKEEL
jgi:exodeoxyribonuclease VII small subunit